MSNKVCLLDWTVLDLCEASYRSPYGYYCDTVKTMDVLNAKIWNLLVVCFNANMNEQSLHYDFILEDYEPFIISPLPFTSTVQDILDLCKGRETPIIAQVTEHGEKCLIIASCYEPWREWFWLIFGDVDEETQTAGIKALQSTIQSQLASIRGSEMTEHHPSKTAGNVPTKDRKKVRNPTWCYWHELFSKMFSELNDRLPRFQSGDFSIRDYMDDAHRKELGDRLYLETNEACINFINNGQWDSNLPNEVICSILNRVNTAMVFCSDLYLWQGPRCNVVVRPPSLSITPYNEVLTFFLIVMHRDIRKESQLSKRD